MKFKYWFYIGLITVAVIVVTGIYKKVQRSKQIKQRKRSIEDYCSTIGSHETIFVSLPSYRDSEIAHTVFSAFEKAACPWRIHIGVCQQNAPHDRDVYEEYRRLAATRGISDFSRNLKVYSIRASDARGPMYARAKIEQHLFNDEKYYLTIDAHTEFTKNWDKQAIEELHKCSSENPILTAYPPNFTMRFHDKDFSQEPVSYLRFKTFDKTSGLPVLEGPVFDRKPRKPVVSTFWASPFSFSYSRVVKKVPYDANFPYAFFGEQFTRGARLWTHGFDFFVPSRTIVKHRWNHTGPTFYELFDGKSSLHKTRREARRRSNRRLRALVNLYDSNEQREADNFQFQGLGLGSERSLKDYLNFCGLDLEMSRAEPYARLGVPADADEEHVLLKFGSLQKYHKLKNLC